MAEDRSAAFGAVHRLPWHREPGERSRFGVILAVIGLMFAVPAVMIPGWTVPERDRADIEEVPPRLAKLVERAEPRPAPKPEPELDRQEKPQSEPVPETLPEVDSEPAPREVPAAIPSEITATEVPERFEDSVDAQTRARETASKSGLFAMKDRLAALTTSHDAPVHRVEANVDGQALAGSADRLPEQTPSAGSGGVVTAQGPSKNVNVAGHTVAEIPVPDAPVVAAQPSVPTQSSGAGERTMSNIRQVFDAQKSALYALYQRELRQDPSLAGKLTLELVIEPDGSVSDCRVLSSELENATLEQRIALRVRMFNFGAADVDTRRVAFPIDFLPG